MIKALEGYDSWIRRQITQTPRKFIDLEEQRPDLVEIVVDRLAIVGLDRSQAIDDVAAVLSGSAYASPWMSLVLGELLEFSPHLLRPVRTDLAKLDFLTRAGLADEAAVELLQKEAEYKFWAIIAALTKYPELREPLVGLMIDSQLSDRETFIRATDKLAAWCERALREGVAEGMKTLRLA